MLVALLLDLGGSEMEMAGSLESTRSLSHDLVIVAQYRSVERCGDRIECVCRLGATWPVSSFHLVNSGLDRPTPSTLLPIKKTPQQPYIGQRDGGSSWCSRRRASCLRWGS